ncbi:hypothetical protein MMC13_000965 [Lambiella insularis]|nr:hypothetical protein [Lambiella insularis]
MVVLLSETATQDIRKSIDDATSDPHKIPGCVVVVVGKDGKPIFSYASGRRGMETQQPMSMESIFWIASCTKLIGAIAAMQLVEQGKLALDDDDLIESICPELKNIKILKSVDDNGNAELIDKKTKITLRMLLTHTAGFGYTFFDDTLRRWGLPVGLDELSGFAEDVQRLPIRFEPGTQWQYGVGIDWAGNVVERVTGMSLNDYFQKHIFQPLGIKNISMFPNEDMKSQLAHMHQKENGKIRTRDHMLRRPLISRESEISQVYNSAGAGCFARPLEYCGE